MPQIFNDFLFNPPTFEELDRKLYDSKILEPMCIVDKNTPIKSKKEGSFLGIQDSHGSLPMIRCPSFFECADTPPWMREMLIEPLKQQLNFECNIIKVQKYINGQSGITHHTDKGIDLVWNSPIYVYRINKDVTKTRCLCFQDKTSKQVTSFEMPHNSLLKIEFKENQHMVHFVPLLEQDASSECISFVFRQSGTFRTQEGLIYGQGAKYATYEERQQDSTPSSYDRSSKEILDMYRFENITDLNETSPELSFSKVREQTF
ncbi:MAG: 2OG-FeII oxygenase [Sylvanvirus sp.]|uniref:2OG-FeII oxygenase n=1 Tax=Sylvanvirus sp. TaxID=2487774 RepID=A0A3G5AH08_9VIRU|nr:MAG: 2OG-FeII oxygenase [Sylvanvirus sp.]